MLHDKNTADRVIGGEVSNPHTVMAADGAVPVKSGYVFITKAGVCAMTITDPVSGVDDGKRLVLISETANAHTLTRATTGFNDGGGGGDLATWGGAKGDGMALVARAGKWWTEYTRNVVIN